MPESTTINLSSIGDTKKLAESIAAQVKKGDVIALYGQLGAGKTEFARNFINYFVNCEVPSPTFTLVQTYKPDNSPEIWHFDLYRIENSQDVFELGIEDALIDGITLIEWPEIFDSFLPKDKIDIKLEYGKNEGERIAHISGCSI